MRDIKDEITFLKKLEQLSLDHAVTNVSESITKLFLGQATRLHDKIEKLKSDMPIKKKGKKK